MSKPAVLTTEQFIRDTQKSVAALQRRPIASRAVKGTVDPMWTTGLAPVKIDGETFYRTQGYPWDAKSGWSPTPGQRVWLVPENPDGYVISGPITETTALMHTVPITSFFNTFQSNDVNWKAPSVTLDNGMVQMEGLGKFGVAPSVDTQIMQLPDPRFYPDKEFNFAAIYNGTNATRLRVKTDGSVWWVAGAGFTMGTGYVSVSSARWPAAGVANWTAVKNYGDATGPAWAQSTLSGVAYWWIDPWGLLWLSGQVTTSINITADNYSLIQPNGAWTIAYQQHFPTSKSGSVIVGIGAIEATSVSPTNTNYIVCKGTTTTLNSGDSMNLDGVIFRTNGADTGGLMTWTAISLLNSWANYDITRMAPAGWARRGNMIFSRGLVRNGSSITAQMWQMPVGTQVLSQSGNTSYGLIELGYSNGAIGRLDLKQGGVANATIGSTTWFSLDTLSWAAEA